MFRRHEDARADYEAAVDIVRSVIDARDPYSLLAGGSPRDEFQPLAAGFVARMRHIHSPDDAAKEIASILARAFEPQYFTSEKCLDLGEQLFSRLKEAGLLSTHSA